MRIPEFVRKKLVSLVNRILLREADMFIGGRDDCYMERWYLIPQNRLFNIYLHCFHRSDDDRALHDHKAHNISIILMGRYDEHLSGGVVKRRTQGGVYFRHATTPHRVALINGRSVLTIFVKLPDYREWGFHCPRGWVHNELFTSNVGKESKVGRGCG